MNQTNNDTCSSLSLSSKFAPVGPIQLLKALQGDHVAEDKVRDYHLLLAHEVLQYPALHQDYVNVVRARWPKAFIMLDNSLIECGQSISAADLVRAYDIVRPDCLIAPDKLSNGVATITLVNDFQKGLTCQQKKNIPLMAVIQGSNYIEALGCYHWYCTAQKQGFNIQYVAVPRVLTDTLGSRHFILRQISLDLDSDSDTDSVQFPFKGIHLLGFSSNPLDDLQCVTYYNVMGIDSAVPLRMAIGHKVPLTFKTLQNFKAPRGEYWQARLEDLSLEERTLLFNNLSVIREWIS